MEQLAQQYNGLTVAQLKPLLASHGLSTAGAKAVLVARLAEHVHQQAEEQSSEGKPEWSWAGDSAKGSQDVWVPYSADMAERLETAWQARLSRLESKLKLLKTHKQAKIDAERYVDLDCVDSDDQPEFWQRRYDDPEGRMRLVRRQVSTPSPAHVQPF
ncbi:MAG: SAP domain-containing protein, partial [archaeon]|nr:SAP domain-containing protein [archaeon]